MKPSTPSMQTPAAWRELFEPTELAPRIAAWLGIDESRIPADRVRVVRCWPARSGFRFQWSFIVDQSPPLALYASPITPADVELPDEHSTDYARKLRGVRVTAADLGLVVHTPDRDRGMPQIKDMLDPDAMKPILAKYLGSPAAGEQPMGTRLACRLLGYKPGRRAALLYTLKSSDGTEQRLLAKTHRDGRGAALVAIHRAVQEQLAEITSGAVDVPQALDFLPAQNAALFAWSSGESIAGGSALKPARLRATVTALAALHRVRPGSLATFTAVDECRIAQRWLAALQQVEPHKADGLQSLLESLRHAMSQITPGPIRTIHRDFYEKQLVWNTNTTTILDLDTLAHGDAALDLGNLLAHVYLHELQATGNTVRLEPIEDLLITQYEAASEPIDRRNVNFYCASSLIRGGALHALRSDTRQYSAQLWEAADQLLKRAGFDKQRAAGRVRDAI